MANKAISMSKVRQIIKLYTQEMGKKKIGERIGMSKHTVKLPVIPAVFTFRILCNV